MAAECVALCGVRQITSTTRVREMHYYYYLSYSHGFAQKRNAFRHPKGASHVSGMRCVFAQNHESERDNSISASLSLS